MLSASDILLRVCHQRGAGKHGEVLANEKSLDVKETV